MLKLILHHPNGMKLEYLIDNKDYTINQVQAMINTVLFCSMYNLTFYTTMSSGNYKWLVRIRYSLLKKCRIELRNAIKRLEYI